MMPRRSTPSPTLRKVLVVDDDSVHLALTRELLLDEGYDVHVHSTGFGATEALRRAAGRPRLRVQGRSGGAAQGKLARAFGP